MAFTIKQGDTAPSYVAAITNKTAGGALDLTSASQILFKMRTHGTTGAPLISAPMTVVGTRSSGEVQYDWTDTDTATAGTYDVEIEITWSDGTVETVPNDSFLTVNVVDDLDH